MILAQIEGFLGDQNNGISAPTSSEMKSLSSLAAEAPSHAQGITETDNVTGSSFGGHEILNGVTFGQIIKNVELDEPGHE
jgi:hypothetical protein